MPDSEQFDANETKRIGDTLGIDWNTVEFEQFRMGLAVEMEHGSHDQETDVTHDDPLTTGKIAWAHIKEFPDYYARLEKMEAEAEQYWSQQRSGRLR